MTSSYAYTAAEPLLKVSHLSVTLGGIPILKDVDFEIRDLERTDCVQGQKVALLAPSGVGKTTLFKRIAGLEPPTSGTVMVGNPLRPVHAGLVGVVPQNYLLFNHRTVGSSLSLAASMNPSNGDPTNAARALLADFGLADKWRSYPCELSGGQRQRVSIAEQLLSSNHFLIMDEPFSGLDILAKKVVCSIIDRVAQRDTLNTIIFSTHDIESAVMVADTVIVLGRERDANGAIIPGAGVRRVFDLIDRDLAWHPDVESMPEFVPTVAEIKALFATL